MKRESIFNRNMVDATLIENVHYSRDNEAWLLSLIMQENSNFDKIDFIKSEHFHFNYHKSLFEVMNLLRANYKEINVATVLGNLTEAIDIPHEYEDYTISDYCNDLLDKTESDNNIVLVAEIVYKCWQRRAFHNVMCHGLQVSTQYNKQLSIKSIMAYIDKLSILIDDGRTDSSLSFLQQLGHSINLIQSGYISESRVNTGYHALDANHRIINKGKVTVIGATTGSGKTAFGLNLVYNISRNTPCLFLTMEMREEEIIQRLWGISCGIEISKLIEHSNRSPKLSNTDFEMMINSDLFDTEDMIVRYHQSTVEDLFAMYHQENKNRLKNSLGKIEVIFIDYIELFDVGNINAKDTYTQYGNITQKLYDFAKQEHVAVIILAQLKREANLIKEDERPNLNHIGLSYKIVKIPDTVIFLSGKDEQLFATILKNRAGSTGEVELFFQRSTQKITEKHQQYNDYSYNRAGDK
jgi:replicative DNA helicase